MKTSRIPIPASSRQISIAQHVVLQAIENAKTKWPDYADRIEDAAEIVVDALEDLKPSRDCRSCDFHSSQESVAWCGYHRAEIPVDAIAEGCDQHQDLGPPF